MTTAGRGRALGPCVLAGESLGALTCLQAVLRGPERFRDLVLVDGAPAASEAAELVLGARHDYPGTVAAFIDSCVPEPGTEHIRRWGRQLLLKAEPEAAARTSRCTPRSGSLRTSAATAGARR